MSDWEKLADEIEDIVGDSVKDLVEGEAPKYKVAVKELAKDFAKAQLRMRRGSEVEQAVARQDLKYLSASLRSKVAESGLELTANGIDTLKRVIGVVARTLLVTAIKL